MESSDDNSDVFAKQSPSISFTLTRRIYDKDGIAVVMVPTSCLHTGRHTPDLAQS